MTNPTIIRDATERNLVRDTIACLDLSQPWAVTIEPYKERRTLNQNALYWKWVGIIAQDTGNDPDAVHEALKQRFLVPVVITFMGDKIPYRSTARLNTGEMSNYMDRVHALASEMGIVLPLPELS